MAMSEYLTSNMAMSVIVRNDRTNSGTTHTSRRRIFTLEVGVKDLCTKEEGGENGSEN